MYRSFLYKEERLRLGLSWGVGAFGMSRDSESYWFFFSPPFFWRRFFQAACEVPELQDKFNIDEYSDLVTLTKPVIYISIGEIINTHTVSIHQSQLLVISSAYKENAAPAEMQHYQIQGWKLSFACSVQGPVGL